jgi:hypothetical protein
VTGNSVQKKNKMGKPCIGWWQLQSAIAKAILWGSTCSSSHPFGVKKSILSINFRRRRKPQTGGQPVHNAYRRSRSLAIMEGQRLHEHAGRDPRKGPPFTQILTPQKLSPEVPVTGKYESCTAFDKHCAWPRPAWF